MRTLQTMLKRPSHELGRRRFLVGAAAAATVLFAGGLASAADATEDVAKLCGTYRFAGGDAERTALRDAIEDVVQGVSAIARPIARARLQEANPVPDGLTLRSDAKLFTLAYAAETFAAPLDGSPVKVETSAGDDLELRIRFEKGTMRQVFSGEGKSRTNLLRREGDRLAIYVRVRADMLPKELVYRLTFERA